VKADGTPRVLVTGGAGFIGSHACEALLAAGLRVRVLDDFSTGNAANLASIWRDIEVAEGSIESPDALTRAMRDVRDVVHLAARSSVAESIAAAETYRRVNVDGTRALLAAAAGAGVRRIVFAASSSAYGDHAAPHDEGMEPRPMSPYAATKVAGEELVREYARSGAGDSVSLRFFNVYGPRQDPNSAYAAVIARFSARIAAGQPVTIYGDGHQTRDFVHVTDTARAIVAAIKVPAALAGEVVNIGTGRATSVLELATLIGRAFGKPVSVLHQPARAGEVRDSVAVTRRAEALLGFRASLAIEHWLASMHHA
jgi:UDP-glucose 4-epimerase